VYRRRAPQWVFLVHPSDEIADLAIDSGRPPSVPSATASSGNTRTDGGVGGCFDFGAAAVSGAAHSLQNFAPGLLVAPHREHCATIGAAHSLQNFAVAEFSNPHFEQRTQPSPRPERAAQVSRQSTQSGKRDRGVFGAVSSMNGAWLPAEQPINATISHVRRLH